MNHFHDFQQFATRRTFLGAIAALLLAIAPSPARGDRQADFAKLVADCDAAREKFRASHTKENPTAADYIRNYDDWPVWQYIPQFVALAEASPADDTAFQCCQWIFDKAGFFPGDGIQFAAEQKAWPIIAAHHATGERVPKLCLQAAQSAGPAREQFLRGLLKQPALSKEHAGYAAFALAELLVKRMDSAEFFQKKRKPPADDLLVNHLQSRFDPAYVQYLSDTSLDACKAESAQQLRTVIDRYGDVPNTISMRHMATLGDRAKQSLYALEHLTIGAVAPPIVGQDLDGHPLKLQDFRGRVVVLSFWFTGCGPCMEMIPEERKLTEKFKDRPFSLLGICGDEDREQAKKTATDEKITWPCWFDGGTHGPITRDYNIRGWPTFYLIDQTGHIVEKNMEQDHMEATITNLLEKNESKK